MFPSLSIVVAAYNEHEAILPFVKRTLDFLKVHVTDGQLILVNDGSSDGTGQVIDQLAKEHSNILSIHLEKNSGMGAALLKGFEVASKHWVTILPADGQIDPYELPHLFELTKEADLVTTLYKNRKYRFGRKLVSNGLRILTVLIVGTRARTEGTYLVRREVLQKLRPCSHSFLLNLEIPIRAKRGGFRVKTAFINVSERIAGRSKAVTIRRVLHTFRDLFALRTKLEMERLGLG